MNSLQLLLFTVIDLYAMALIFRTWFQFAQVDFYNPTSQFLVKITQPVVAPLRKVVPTLRNIDFAPLLLAWLLFVMKFPIVNFISPIFSAEAGWETFAFIGALNLLRDIGKVIFYALMISAIMSWFSRGNNMQYILYQLTAPLLAPIKRILPNTGMVDFSPMVLAFVLFFLDRAFYDLFKNYWVLASL